MATRMHHRRIGNTRPLLLFVLALFLALASAGESRAELRVQVDVVTPHLRVQVASPPVPAVYPVRVVRGRRVRPVQYRPAVIVHRRPLVLRLNRHDRVVARRLSLITGYSRRLLLDYRRAGYTWRELAFELGIRRAELKAASNSRAFHRFLRRHHHRRF